MIEIEQCGEGPELEWIKEKVFGRKINLSNAPLKSLPKYKKEKNLHTFIGMRSELRKDHVINDE
jgi:hypothetical protein